MGDEIATMQAEWKWCATHGDPVQVFSDGSLLCVHDLLVGATAFGHEVVEWREALTAGSELTDAGIEFCIVHRNCLDHPVLIERGRCEYGYLSKCDVRPLWFRSTGEENTL